MSIVEIILYGILAAGIALGVAIPGLRWYRYNVSMFYKKRFTIIFPIALVIIIILTIIINSV